MRNAIFVVLVFLFYGCASGAMNEDVDIEDMADDLVPIAAQDSGAQAKQANLEFKSSLSQYVQLTENKDYIRFAYSFFPERTNYDFEKKTVTIPCSFLTVENPDVHIQLSVNPIETPCDNPYHYVFSDGSFTLNGIVLPFETARDLFVQNFGFRMKENGFFNATDDTLLTSIRGKLEDYYQLVLDRK